MSLFIDHVVITVTDINKSIHFYSNILGMELQEFLSTTDNVKRKSLKFGTQKINLHAYDNIIKPGAKIPKPGTGDICFISDIDILEWEKIFHNNSIQIEFGPTKQIGAEGELFSIYVRDPDENLIEIANRIK